MAVRDILKVNRKTFFNPTRWMGWNAIVDNTANLWAILKPLFTPPAPGVAISFEEAMKEYELTEADLAEGITTYRTLAFVFLVLGGMCFLYACYLLVRYTSIAGCILGLAVAILLFSQAYKYDFWALQMRRRHLGLTFADWKRQYFG